MSVGAPEYPESVAVVVFADQQEIQGRDDPGVTGLEEAGLGRGCIRDDHNQEEQ